MLFNKRVFTICFHILIIPTDWEIL